VIFGFMFWGGGAGLSVVVIIFIKIAVFWPGYSGPGVGFLPVLRVVLYRCAAG